MKSKPRMNPIKWIGFLLVSLIAAGTMDAHRVFVVSETGVVQEVKKGSISKGFLGVIHADLKPGRPVVLPKPLKIYIKVDDVFDPEEWSVGHMELVSGTPFVPKLSRGSHKKYYSYSNISEDIVEIELTDEKYYTKPISSSKEKIEHVMMKENGVATLPDISIAYNPSKKNQQDGKEPRYWFIKMSENDYDPDEVGWTQSQVEYSINEIIATKNTTK